MKHLLLEDKKPSERTLNFIRQIAYTCRAVKLSTGQTVVCCLN